MRQIRIGERAIGDGAAPFVIAEVGINHNGELERALRMIDAAQEAGADAVKFQTFKAEELCGNRDQTYTYRSQGLEVTESMLDMFRRYEFSFEEWRQIRDYCRTRAFPFLSTPQNISDFDDLLKLGIDAIKVGSDDLTNLPLLSRFADAGLPIILSCGMADLAEIHQALDCIGAFDGHPTALLYCVSQYPTPPEQANLRKLETLRRAFPGQVIGFSDHSQGPLAASLAVAFGAALFEKHFTLDHDLPGPDHWFSEDPAGLRDWVAAIRSATILLGDGVVRPSAAEKEMRLIARRSIAALRDIAAGEKISGENFGARRPGDGLPPALLSGFDGMQLKRSLKKGERLSFDHFKD